MTRLLRFRLGGLRALPFLLAVGSLGASSPLASPVHASDILQSTPDEQNPVFEKAKPAIVKVVSGDEGLLSAGTGFFIDGQGTVLTSSTVLGSSTSARVTINGLPLDAKILGNDPRSGLAMLKVNYPDSPFLNLAGSTDLKTGDAVSALGYPLNLPVSPSEGVVSGFEIHYLNRFFCTTHIHADVSISPGQVGSPLLNPKGDVVGLVVPSPDDGHSTYALPSAAIEKIMGDFQQYGRARHGWVGVTVFEAPDTLHDGRTVRVVEAVPGTPASKSGIRPGDTVMRIDAREIYRPSDVMDASFFSHVGGTMSVVVRREDALLSYSFAVIERPQPAIHPVSSSASGESRPEAEAAPVMAKSP